MESNNYAYSIFLMHQLAVCSEVINKELEYDLAWEQACDLYREFESSKYDDDNKGEYECILEFLEDKKAPKQTIQVKQKFDVEVCRTGFGFRTISVDAFTYEEACELILERAGGFEFSEKDAEYSIV